MSDTPDFKAIAAQLRQPSGAEGITTAERMHDNNCNMIRRCIDHLAIHDGDKVLEMGPGGGAHLPYVLEQATGIHYTGIDISATMTELAISQNKEATTGGHASFITVAPQDGYVRIPDAANTYNRIFTVNTLYFWDNAAAQAEAIYRVLKPGGTFALCFATEAFMKTLPFTEFGFNLYDIPKAQALLTAAGFTIRDILTEKEQVTSNAGQQVERAFVVMLAGKL